MEEGLLEIKAVPTEFESLVGVAYPDCQPELALRAEADKPRLCPC